MWLKEEDFKPVCSPAELQVLQQSSVENRHNAKLSDGVLYFYITFYNKLHGKCGIVSCSTPYLVKRLERGVKLGKLGYEEIKSRMGVIRYLPVVNEDDIEAVCVVNGVTDKAIIKKITDISDNDLRYAQPKVIAAKNLNV